MKVTITNYARKYFLNSLTFVLLCITFAYMKTETIIVRADEELKKRLKLMADKDHRTLSDYIRLQLEKLTGLKK